MAQLPQLYIPGCNCVANVGIYRLCYSFSPSLLNIYMYITFAEANFEEIRFLPVIS